MHVYFSGIGGAGIGPLALIAHQAGFQVSGSDSQQSDYIEYLRKNNIDNIFVGQDGSQIATTHSDNPIDWLVRSSAVTDENPEVVFATSNSIPVTKRDEFIVELLKRSNQKMVAIAGTHGKTTTTAMVVWLFKQLEIPVSYSVGAKLSFGSMGEFDKDSEFFVYEADEYDRNFLSFYPELSIIPGVGYDHPDIYPSKSDYTTAFLQFFKQSKSIIAHPDDIRRVTSVDHFDQDDKLNIFNKISLVGLVNRKNAQLAVEALYKLELCKDIDRLVALINQFPGTSRRFEKLASNIYTDYAHTPEKIRGALQLAQEVNGLDVVVVYEGLHNTRQHFIKKELEHMFSGIKKLYIVPSYRAREDESLEELTPKKLADYIQEPADREPVLLNDALKNTIVQHSQSGDLVLCLSAGGGGSLDEWLRRELQL